MLHSAAKFNADSATEQVDETHARDIQTRCTFKRDTANLMRQMNKMKPPVMSTVNDKAKLIVQGADSCQKLLEAKDRMEAIEGIKRGLESMRRQRGKPATEFFREFFGEKGMTPTSKKGH